MNTSEALAKAEPRERPTHASGTCVCRNTLSEPVATSALGPSRRAKAPDPARLLHAGLLESVRHPGGLLSDTSKSDILTEDLEVFCPCQ